MAKCLKAVGFVTQVGQSVYDYSAMDGDNTLITDMSEVWAVIYGAATLDSNLAETTLGPSSLAFNFEFGVQDVVGVTIIFYP